MEHNSFPRWLYIPIAAALAFWMTENAGGFAKFAHDAVRGDALAPYQYRPLFAYFFVAIEGLAGLFVATWAFWFITFATLAILSHEWLARWLTEERAIIWTLVSLLLSMGFIWFIPAGSMWSALEAVFWLVALLLLYHGRVWWLLPLVFVATLNRETTIFIPLLALLVTRHWRLPILLGIVWAATYGALRLYYGPVPVYVTLAEIWAMNRDFWGVFFLGLILFGWIPVLAVRGYRGAPEMLQRAAWVAPGYLAAIAVFGVWREFRLFIPLLPVAIPLAVGGLAPQPEQSSLPLQVDSDN